MLDGTTVVSKNHLNLREYGKIPCNFLIFDYRMTTMNMSRHCPKSMNQLCLLLLVVAVTAVQSKRLDRLAFAPTREVQQRSTQRRPNVFTYSANTSELDKQTGTEDDESSSSMATLTLAGTYTASSDPVPFPSSSAEQEDVLLDFLKTPKNRNLLVTAGGERSGVQELFVSPDLYQDWKDACSSVGASIPPTAEAVNKDSCSSLLLIETPAMSFPGMKLVSKSQIGLNFVTSSDEPPKYEAVGVGSPELTASGLPPVVWIYNKLTGSGKEKDDASPAKKKSSTETRSFSTVTYQLNDKKDSVVFTSDVLVSVEIRFPSFLLKILPTTKEKAEENGGKSIVKAVEKDVQKSMKGIQEAFETWLKEV